MPIKWAPFGVTMMETWSREKKNFFVLKSKFAALTALSDWSRLDIFQSVRRLENVFMHSLFQQSTRIVTSEKWLIFKQKRTHRLAAFFEVLKGSVQLRLLKGRFFAKKVRYRNCDIRLIDEWNGGDWFLEFRLCIWSVARIGKLCGWETEFNW